MKKYTKKDFLDYATAFNYDFNANTENFSCIDVIYGCTY